MPGINTGILHNAYPLTTAQIRELEEKALTTGKTFVYLDSSGKITFTGKVNPKLIKDLAWHNTCVLTIDEDLLTKKVYTKLDKNTFTLEAILQKNSLNDSWTAPTEHLNMLDIGLLDEFILE